MPCRRLACLVTVGDSMRRVAAWRIPVHVQVTWTPSGLAYSHAAHMLRGQGPCASVSCTSSSHACMSYEHACRHDSSLPQAAVVLRQPTWASGPTFSWPGRGCTCARRGSPLRKVLPASCGRPTSTKGDAGLAALPRSTPCSMSFAARPNSMALAHRCGYFPPGWLLICFGASMQREDYQK